MDESVLQGAVVASSPLDFKRFTFIGFAAAAEGCVFGFGQLHAMCKRLCTFPCETTRVLLTDGSFVRPERMPSMISF